jgi:hypothetical protein
MRKTLAVLVLMISSMLLLQAPAWAPTASTVGPDHHLIRINKIGSYEALTDCPSTSTVEITPRSGAKPVRAQKAGKKLFAHHNRNRFTFDVPSGGFSRKTLEATCDGKAMIIDPDVLDPSVPLAFTGGSLVPQLLLGTGLLLVGTMLLVVTGRFPAGLLRRRSGRATPS